jgi:para-nitrobenzyl esterase
MIHLHRPFLAFDSAMSSGEAFAAKLGVSGDDQIGQLRALSTDRIYEVARAERLLGSQYPVIDGHVLPESPFAAFARGRQAPVPLMIGSNADEGSILHAAFEASSPDGSMQAEMVGDFGDDIVRLAGLYPGLDRRDDRAEIDFMGDALFGAGVYWYARHHQAAGHPTHLYMFTRNPKGKRQTVGAYHAAELAFVHGSNVPLLPMTKDDKALSVEMMKYWTDFAKGGHPNGGPATAAHPYWPRFDDTDPRWMRFDHRIGMETVARLDKYEIINARRARLVEEMSRAVPS